MKLNISYPATGCQKTIEIEDDNKLRAFYDKRMSAEVAGEHLGDEWKGYILKISGGNDKQGFPMKQGVLTASRVRLLLRPGHSCYRPRKRGERKRKSVRGCIVSSELSILNLVVVKKGDAEIEGLTDTEKPRRLGPKRANHIRKMFNLTKEDDVRKYVIRREVKKDGKKSVWKAPKIQRLITPRRLQHKRELIAIKRKRWQKTRAEAEEFNKMMSQRVNQAKNERQKKHMAARRASLSNKADEKAEGKTAAAPAAKPAKTVKDSKASASQPVTQTAGASKASAPVPKKPAAADKQATKKMTERVNKPAKK